MIPKAIDSLCDQFETSLKRNENVLIEDLLPSVPDDQRGSLLYELLGVEMEFHLKRGKVIYLDELRHRFADHLDVVARVVRSFLWEGSDFAAAAGDWPGSLRQFSLKAIAGRGSFGTVWVAEDTHLNREVAIKTPHAYSQRNTHSEAVIREASAAARLRHPNILPVHEVAELNGRWFIVTDYISGGTLKQHLKIQPVSCGDVAKFGGQLADALHHAHSHGVYHRDLKPSNILVDDQGNLLIADFGLAITSQQAAGYSENKICGTAAYMAPEQAAGRLGGERADIYSLGVILEDLIETAVSSASDRPRREATGHSRSITRWLNRVRERCCHLDPSQRYASAESLAADLKRIAAGRIPRGVKSNRHARSCPGSCGGTGAAWDCWPW